MKINLTSLKAKFNKLNYSEKISFLLLLLILLLSPLFVFAAMKQKGLNSRASEPISPPITSPYTPPTPPENPSALFNQGFITPTNSENINPKLGFTIEAWIKPTSTIFNSNIFSKTNSISNSLILSVQSDKDPLSDKFIVVYTFAVGSQSLNCSMRTITNQKLFSQDELLNNWQHIAGVIQNNGQLDIFVNGEKSEMNFNSIFDPCSQNIPITIGARGSNLDSYFPGMIDEVRISNYPRFDNNFEPLHDYSINTNDLLFYPFNYFEEQKDTTNNGHYANLTGDVTFVPQLEITSTPTPTQTPTKTPTPTKKPTIIPTKKPSIIPTKSPTPTPIKCGKINQICCKTAPFCQGGLTCYKGYCRYINVIR